MSHPPAPNTPRAWVGKKPPLSAAGAQTLEQQQQRRRRRQRLAVAAALLAVAAAAVLSFAASTSALGRVERQALVGLRTFGRHEAPQQHQQQQQLLVDVTAPAAAAAAANATSAANTTTTASTTTTAPARPSSPSSPPGVEAAARSVAFLVRERALLVRDAHLLHLLELYEAASAPGARPPLAEARALMSRALGRIDPWALADAAATAAAPSATSPSPSAAKAAAAAALSAAYDPERMLRPDVPAANGSLDDPSTRYPLFARFVGHALATLSYSGEERILPCSRRDASLPRPADAAAAATTTSAGAAAAAAAAPLRLLVAGNLFNSELLMPNYMLQLLRFLVDDVAAGQAYVAIYESGSSDHTPQHMALLAMLLEPSGVPFNLTIDGVLLRRGPKHDRISFLAAVRNAIVAPSFSGRARREPGVAAECRRRWPGASALSPASASAPSGRHHPGGLVPAACFDPAPTEVLFLNDVFFCADDLKRIVAHSGFASTAPPLALREEGGGGASGGESSSPLPPPTAHDLRPGSDIACALDLTYLQVWEAEGGGADYDEDDGGGGKTKEAPAEQQKPEAAKKKKEEAEEERRDGPAAEAAAPAAAEKEEEEEAADATTTTTAEAPTDAAAPPPAAATAERPAPSEEEDEEEQPPPPPQKQQQQQQPPPAIPHHPPLAAAALSRRAKKAPHRLDARRPAATLKLAPQEAAAAAAAAAQQQRRPPGSKKAPGRVAGGASGRLLLSLDGGGEDGGGSSSRPSFAAAADPTPPLSPWERAALALAPLREATAAPTTPAPTTATASSNNNDNDDDNDDNRRRRRRRALLNSRPVLDVEDAAMTAPALLAMASALPVDPSAAASEAARQRAAVARTRSAQGVDRLPPGARRLVDDLARNYGVGGALFYDRWVARGGDGRLFDAAFPYVLGRFSGRVGRGLPVPVQACWNGLARLRAAPFARGLRFRRALLGECNHGECSLVADDFARMGFGRALVDPAVQVSYKFLPKLLLTPGAPVPGSSVDPETGLPRRTRAEGIARVAATAWRDVERGGQQIPWLRKEREAEAARRRGDAAGAGRATLIDLTQVQCCPKHFQEDAVPFQCVPFDVTATNFTGLWFEQCGAGRLDAGSGGGGGGAGGADDKPQHERWAQKTYAVGVLGTEPHAAPSHSEKGKRVEAQEPCPEW
jgi:hypothetical protein